MPSEFIYDSIYGKMENISELSLTLDTLRVTLEKCPVFWSRGIPTNMFNVYQKSYKKIRIYAGINEQYSFDEQELHNIDFFNIFIHIHTAFKWPNNKIEFFSL